MSPKTRRLLFILLGVALVGALVAWAVIKSRSKPDGTPVEIGVAERSPIEERVSASGRIFPVTEVAISSDVSGEIFELAVAEGDSIREGDLIARIDPEAVASRVSQTRAGVDAARAQAATSRAAIEQARATRKQLEATLAVARQALERAGPLNAEGLLSDAELEQAQNAVDVAQANLDANVAAIRSAEESANAADFQVKSQQAALSEVQTNLARTSVYAPMTGIVSLLSVEQGERVVGTIQMTGTEMARIADLSQMEVRVEVSENDIPRVTLADSVEIEVDAYLDRTFAGTVTEIASSADNLQSATGAAALTTDQVTNFTVAIGIDPASYADLVTPERPYPFRPGMSAAVEIVTEVVDDALVVPVAAVTAREVDGERGGARGASDRDLEEVVWVVTPADTVERRRVRTGVQSREVIAVTEGLEAGDRIVVGPYSAISRQLDGGDEVYEDEGGGSLGEGDGDAD